MIVVLTQSLHKAVFFPVYSVMNEGGGQKLSYKAGKEGVVVLKLGYAWLQQALTHNLVAGNDTGKVTTSSRIKLDIKMLRIIIRLLGSNLLIVIFCCHASEINLYSVNTGSFVYHLTGNHGQYTENFENNFFSVERKLSEDSKYRVLLGTMKNSFDDRCLAMGVRRDWASWDNGWVFKGVYGYTGEFFFDAFKDCGNHGSYHDFKKATGIGFSPYIYHGFQYNFTSYFGIETGIIIPSVFVITVQWSFR